MGEKADIGAMGEKAEMEISTGAESYSMRTHDRYIEISLSEKEIVAAKSIQDIEISLLFNLAQECCTLGRQGKSITEVETYFKSSHERVLRVYWKYSDFIDYTQKAIK